MNRFDFIDYIEKYGFYNYGSRFYKNEKYIIKIYNECYKFYDGYKWGKTNVLFDDLRPLKQITRCIKLKKILD